MASRIQAILARDVPNLGRVGEVVKVAPGYLRNFLLPKRLALLASKKSLEQFEHHKQLINHQLQKLKAQSSQVRDRIEAQKFTILVKAGENDKIFGSIGSRDIEKALSENGFTIDHRDIKLESGPLKTIGAHTVGVRLEGGVDASLKIILAPLANEEDTSAEAKNANEDTTESDKPSEDQ